MSDKCTPVNIADYFKPAVTNPQGKLEGEKGEASPPSGSDIPPLDVDKIIADANKNSYSALAAEKASISQTIDFLNSGLDAAKAVGTVIDSLLSNPALRSGPEILLALENFKKDNNAALPVLQSIITALQNLGIDNIEQVRQLKQFYKDSGMEAVVNGIINVNNTIESLANADPQVLAGQLARAIQGNFPRNGFVNGIVRGSRYIQKGIDFVQAADQVAAELVGAAEALLQASTEAVFAACQALKATSLLISQSNLIWSTLQQLAGAAISNFVNNLQMIVNKFLGIKIPVASSWNRLQSFTGVNWGIDISNSVEKCLGLFKETAEPVIANEVLNKIGQVKSKVQQANRGIGLFQKAIMSKPGSSPIKNTWASAKSMVSIAPNPTHILTQEIPSLSGIITPTTVPSNLQGVGTAGQTSIPDQELTRPVVSSNGTIIQAVPSAITNISNGITLAGDNDKLSKLSNDLGASMVEFSKKIKEVSKIYSDEDILDYAKEFIKTAKELAARQNLALVPSSSGESEVELILIAKEYFECLYKNRPVFRPPGSPDPNGVTPPTISKDPNLILYLAFNEDVGSTSFSNSSMYDFTVTPSSNLALVEQAEKGNNALELKLKGNLLINGTDSGKLKLESDFTIEFWLKPSTFNDLNLIAGPFVFTQQTFAFRLNKDGFFEVAMFQAGWAVQAKSVSSLVKDTWSKIEVVKKDKKLLIFIKGKKEVEIDFISPVDFSQGLQIGNFKNGSVIEQYAGLIDEFKIFDVAKYSQDHSVGDVPPSGTEDSGNNNDGSSESGNNNGGNGGSGSGGSGGNNSGNPINVVTTPPVESDLDPRVTDNPEEEEKRKIDDALSGSGTLPYSAVSTASKNQGKPSLSAAELTQNPLLGLPLGFMSSAQQNIVRSFTDPDVFPEVSEFPDEFLKDDETGELFSSKYNRLLYVVIALLCRNTSEWEEFKKFKGLDTKIIKIRAELLKAQAHDSLYSKTVLQGYGGNSPFIWLAQGARTVTATTMAESLLLFLQHQATEQQVVPIYNWLETNESIDFSTPLALGLNVPEKEAATESFDYVNTHRQNFADTYTSLRDAADMIGGPLGFEYVVVLAIMLLMTRIQNMLTAKKSHKEVAQVADIAIELTKYLSAKSAILLDLRMLRGF